MCGCSTPSSEAIASTVAGAAFTVEDMTCNHCAGTIRKAFAAGMPGTPISIDLARHVVIVAGDAVQAEEIIRDAGFAPQAMA